MKPQKVILELDDEQEVSIGLIRLTKEVPSHEFIFHLNNLNYSQFSRIKDVEIKKKYYNYFHPCYQTYSENFKSIIQIFGNKSTESIEKKKTMELFSIEDSENLILPQYSDVNYIIKTEDIFDDFSLILLPEDLAHPVEVVNIPSESELYTFFQHYE